MTERTTGDRGMRAGTAFLLQGMLGLGKRLGLGKQLVRLVFKGMFPAQNGGKSFASYQPTEHDVFVATFVKSGTNWMLQISQQIAHYGEAEFEHIHDVAPWPDAPFPDLIPLEDTAAREQAPTGLRVIKTHLASDFVPYDEKATYLTVLRDPKEVVVSSYYFFGGMLGLLSHVSIDDWLDTFLRPESMAAAWAAHTASFWNWRDRPNALVLNFGEIKDEPRAAIERIARMMGVHLSEAQLATVLERSGFDYMKAHESQFAVPRLPFVKEADLPSMVRRGASGESGELLSRAQQAEIDRTCQGELRQLGSDFPYATAFDVAAEPAT